MMKNSSLESYTIKFLYNLSFDVTLCDDILKVGLLPKITDLIGISYTLNKWFRYININNYVKLFVYFKYFKIIIIYK